MAERIPAVTVKTDGRKRRWHQHKVERRNELVDGTIEAIRRHGRFLSMDEIAAEIGVSKTVLYRYFVDKNDLTTAVMMRFTQTTLIPNMIAALSADMDGFE
ncbi:helix-turn-helix transcriptional regulator, partial [Escherichia coli]|nr:helix-turn-helix transcriptional regulator [Escherichia coli]